MGEEDGYVRHGARVRGMGCDGHTNAEPTVYAPYDGRLERHDDCELGQEAAEVDALKISQLRPAATGRSDDREALRWLTVLQHR